MHQLSQRGADLGDPLAISNLGYCFQNGVGVAKDQNRAFQLFQQAADLGNSNGLNNLAFFFYQHGDGSVVALDIPRSIQLYHLAADMGNRISMNNLGYCYERGIGGELNYALAAEWYRKGVDLGELYLCLCT